MSDTTTGIVCAIVLLVTLVVSWCTNWENRWKFRHIPGPGFKFPLGNMLTMRKKMTHRALADWHAEYGDTFKVFFARQPMLVTSDPYVARQVTVKNFNNFHDRFMLNLQKSLLTGTRLEADKASIIAARGPYWGSLRAGLQPMFHNVHLAAYADVINQAVTDLIDNLQSVAKTGEQVDIHRHLGRMTMQVIGAAAFGVKFDTQSAAVGDDVTLVKAAKSFFENGRPSFWNLCAFIVPNWVLPVLSVLAKAFPNKGQLGREFSVATMFEASDCLIENARKKYFKDSKAPPPWKWYKDDPNNPLKDTIPAESSVISTLLKANNKASGTNFNQIHIAAQTSAMMLAGYETTSSALAFSIYLLGKHPDAQRQLLQEVDAFKGRIGYDNLSEFPYTAAVLNETLRLYSALPALLRESLQDAEVGGYHIPRGTPVLIDLWALHRNEKYWQDAEAFKPERWLGDKTGGDKTGGLAYLPFGAGPRMCIGIKLAVEEAVIALVRLYQQYTFELTDELLSKPVEVKQTVTMTPKHGVYATVVQRRH